MADWLPFGGLGTGYFVVGGDGAMREEVDGPVVARACLEIGEASVPVGGEAVLRFPQLTTEQEGVVPGLDLCCVWQGSVVPHNELLSSLPGGLLLWQVANRRPEPVTVTCRLQFEGGGDEGAPVPWSDGPGWIARNRQVNDRLVSVAAAFGQGAPLLFEDASEAGVGIQLDLEPGEHGVAIMAVAWDEPGDQLWRSFVPGIEDVLQTLLEHIDDMRAACEVFHGLVMDSDLTPEQQRGLLADCHDLVVAGTLAGDGCLKGAGGAAGLLFPRLAGEAVPAGEWQKHLACMGFGYDPERERLRLDPPPGSYPVLHPQFWATATRMEDQRVMLLVRNLFVPGATMEMPSLWVSEIDLPTRTGRTVQKVERQPIVEGTIVTWYSPRYAGSS